MTEPTRPEDADNTISPLPGEPGIPDVAGRPRNPWSRKGLLAVVLPIFAIFGIAALTVHQFARSKGPAEPADSRRAGDRPVGATSDPRPLDMPSPAPRPAASAPRIPALVATDEERAEPIGVRRTGEADPNARGSGKKQIRPEDAPVLLVSARPAPDTTPEADQTTSPMDTTARNLQAYQRQLQGLLDNLAKSTAIATGQAPSGALLGGPPSVDAALAGVSSASVSPTGGGLFGGQLQESTTPRVAASMLGNRSLTLPKGTAFTCALKTKVISATSGLVGCQVQRNVFSDDGRVLLIERGSHMDGEYRIASVRPGMVRIPVLWTRIRTPLGVTVDIGSPGTGPLGESGIDGHVDNRWGERIGAAMLLSVIDDAVSLVIQNQTQESSADTIVLPSTAANSSKLAEKVLESTINIPPLIYQNQGGLVGIYVARDVDFSSVYELKAVAR